VINIDPSRKWGKRMRKMTYKIMSGDGGKISTINLHAADF
jgi:hypothetical protein